jgi:hypothetical protein
MKTQESYKIMPNQTHTIAKTQSVALTSVGAGPCACPLIAPSRGNMHVQPRGDGQPQEKGQPRGVAPTEVKSKKMGSSLLLTHLEKWKAEGLLYC